MSILREVIKDLIAREEVGIKSYGSPLSVDSKNDPLQYAYEEALDLCMYLRQEIEKRKKPEERFQDIVHNHAPNEGPEIPCLEINLWNGRRIGKCLLPKGWEWSKK